MSKHAGNLGDTTYLVRMLLHDTLKEIMHVLNAESGSLFIFDAQRQELVLDSFYNSAQIEVEGIRKRIGEGVSGKVVDMGGPVFVKDIDTDSRFSRNGFSHYQTKSFISLPLLTADSELLGVINIADKADGQPFSENDFEVAVALCKNTCVMAEYLKHNNRLKKDTEMLGKENSLLNKYASVGKLAAGIVHEINNPLDGIIRYTNMLLEQTEQDSITAEYLLEIKKGLDRIANITKSLVEFSHCVSSKAHKPKAYSDVHALIEDSLEVMKEKISSHKITVRKAFEPALEEVLDRGLFHVVNNLIRNAIEAMPKGGFLDISTQKHNGFVKIRFSDSGCGISDELKERIFEPFFSTKTVGDNTGLGLAICKEIIDIYQGSIEVESSLGRGTTFTVVIPNS